MKLTVLILLLLFTDPMQLAKINTLKKEANEAYKSGKYDLAASKYSMLSDSLGVYEDEILLNLAHSYFHLGDTAGARVNYEQVTISPDKKLRSIASQQLGVLAKNSQKLEESLSHLKNSIKADPTNTGAKYDYELVKKLIDQQKENQQNQDQNKDQNKDEDDKEKEDIIPSEFAKQVKAKADQLRMKGDFDGALKTFEAGLQKDQTVAAYNEIISRLKKITGNDE